MTTQKSEIGIIGLAVMGANLARNFASREIRTSAYNRSTAKMTALIEEHGNEFLHGQETLEEFVDSLAVPRKIMIMVKSGKPVDMVIDSLKPLLEKGDIIIDGGNSYYHDTQRRFESLETKGFHYVGCGVSGGEDGALYGPSLMPGGSRESWDILKPLLEKIAAKDFSDEACVTYCGHGPSGHYVKMIHNGIEYGVMQIMAESYNLLKNLYNLSAFEISEIFAQYNQGKLKSFLFDTAVEILAQEDPNHSGEALLDYILDKAAQKGTGKWTVIDAFERAIPTPTINEAVNARILSSFKQKRVALSQTFESLIVSPSWDIEQFIPLLEEAMHTAIIITYAQGYHLLETANQSEGWDMNLSEVSRIWQGGCIIRADLLKTLTESFKDIKAGTHLFEIEDLHSILMQEIESLNKVITIASESSLPFTCLGVSLNYFQVMTTEQSSANFIQGLRDNFGAHTYQRIDKEGDFHTEWG